MITQAFEITFLGTSAASIWPNSSTSACLVQIGQTKILVDAGIGVLRQLNKISVHPEEIHAILISHWHYDHCAGLANLLKSHERTSPLPVYGPIPPLITRIYLRSLYRGISAHLIPVQDGFSVDFNDVRAQAVTVSHDIATVGWTLAEKQPSGRRIVISGDTRPVEKLVDAAREADMLVHEATYMERHSSWAAWRGHSTARDAANQAVKAGVGALALTHLPSRYSRQSVLMEAQAIFPGVLVPLPLDKISVGVVPAGTVKMTHGWASVKLANLA